MIQLSSVNTFNVQATMNQWMGAHLALFALPAWLTSAQPAIVLGADDITASIPCFALFHLPVTLDHAYQGGHVGGGMLGADETGLMEVSCYTSANDPQGQALQRLMRDWVKALVVADRVVSILDFQGDLYNPVASGYKIDISDLTEVETQADPNPDVQRARMLISYSYTFRASIA